MTDTILSQNEEDKCWSLYLAAVSNPASEVGSFADFMNRIKPVNIKQLVKKPVARFDSKSQIIKAEKILKNFKPPNGR